MRRSNLFLATAGMTGFVLFFCLLVWLLLLRYERGDIYPAYSTLRADPLGTRAYYEALESLPPYTVVRGFTSLHRELEQKPGSFLFLGLEADDLAGPADEESFLATGAFTQDEIKELDAFVRNGGRVVITFAPQEPESVDADDAKKAGDKKKKPSTKPDKSTTEPTNDKSSERAPQPDENTAPPKTEQERYERDLFRKEQEDEAKDNPGGQRNTHLEKYRPSLAAIWGFGWDVAKVDKPKADPSQDDADADSDASPQIVKPKPEVLAEPLSLSGQESGVPWKSALYFVRVEPEWQPLYSAKSHPVVIERAWGKGEIVLATDSYFISNEGLRNDRRPALVSLLTGHAGNLLFDETHLGTQQTEGVMYLADKFRLEGYFYGLIGVVFLFLWRNSVPLVPPRAAGDPTRLGGAVSGKDSRSGLVNLLRRNISAADILKTSLVEWRRNATPGRRHLQDKAAEMEKALSAAPGGKADQIVQSYHQLREINTPAVPKENMQQNLEQLSHLLQSVRAEVGKVILGQQDVIDKAIITILIGQHALIEGVPGVAKTLLVRTLAHVLGCDFSRIQFTPDLMPADITGTSVFNFQKNEFTLMPGPVFTTFLLGDEINRAPAKTQSALLQAMQERMVTIDRHTYELSPAFTVFATQNPIEYEGTYPLAEAQKDRFALKISMPFPEREDEFSLARRMLGNDSPEVALANGVVQPLLTLESLAESRRTLEQLAVRDEMLGYILDVVRATRTHEAVLVGAGPRATQSLLLSSRAIAALSGHDFVSPDDVRSMVAPVLEHRLILRPEYEVEGLSINEVLQQILQSVPVPR